MCQTKPNPTEKKRFMFLYCFVFLPILLFTLSQVEKRPLVANSPDANLYLSVADNFLQTGHFVQTVRAPGSYVVPFGAPLILTVLRLLRFDLPMIVIFQYALHGGTCLFLFKSEENVFPCGAVSPLVYTLALFRAHLYYNCIRVECYFLFCIAGIIWCLSERALSEKRRTILINLFGFVGFSVRTVLIVFYIPILLHTVYLWIHKRIPRKMMVALLLFPCLILSLNTLNNKMETGHWIVTDNYAGGDIYIANNPYTKPVYYSASMTEELVGEEYYQITNDPTLDYTEKNEILLSLAKTWIRENPKEFLSNTSQKFNDIFIKFWRHLLTVSTICGVIYILKWSPHKWLSILCLALNAAVAVLTSCGLIMGRYTMPVWPLASLHMSAAAHWVFGFVSKHVRKTK
ncbi:MAG: hypothetical protein IJT62_01000 [Oscillospiraceae bacterium]|nr:hypothetical protein [Oscillospiraceae bacterium]